MVRPDVRAAAVRARGLDLSDPLGRYTGLFLTDGDVESYLDGNSLGRPLARTLESVNGFVRGAWGRGLIRSWDDAWLDLPLDLGDRIARITLGAASGQTVVGDSTTVLLYKLCRGARAMRPGRDEVVIDRANFPTDRYLLEGIAAETGLTVRWVDTELDGGVTVDGLAEVVGRRTAFVLVTHVAYRSGHIADAAAIADLVHTNGALLVLDVCHSVGAVELRLDDWGVDLAVGCTYKYLNGGPGAPAFCYVARRHLEAGFEQPVQGWMGARDIFAMGPHYRPADGVRRMLSGTPPVFAMLPMSDMLDVIEDAGMTAVRLKSLELTAFAVELFDAYLAPYGVTLSSPRDPAVRGGHITVDHPLFQDVTARLWRRGVVPDFRGPTGIRIGMSPLSTRFAEVATGVVAVLDELLTTASD